MLDKLRRPGRSHKEGQFKKMFSIFIFGLICIVFIFIAPMGVNLTGQGVVGKVGNDFIQTRELRMLEENIRNQYKSRLEQANEEENSKLQKQIRQMAVQSLVHLYLINYALKKENLFLTDEELINSIQNISAFQEKGRFSKTRYITLLKNINLSRSHFEESERKRLLADKWQNTFNKSISDNKLEKAKKEARHEYKVNLRYAEMKAGEIEEEKLEPFVEEKNKKEITKFLKKANTKWEKTGEFSLLLPMGVSIAYSPVLIEAVISQLPSKGVIPKLIREDNKVYVVEILSFTKKNISAEEKQLSALMSQNFDKSNRLFDSWISTKKEHIKIEVNSEQM